MIDEDGLSLTTAVGVCGRYHCRRDCFEELSDVLCPDCLALAHGLEVGPDGIRSFQFPDGLAIGFDATGCCRAYEFMPFDLSGIPAWRLSETMSTETQTKTPVQFEIIENYERMIRQREEDHYSFELQHSLAEKRS